MRERKYIRILDNSAKNITGCHVLKKVILVHQNTSTKTVELFQNCKHIANFPINSIQLMDTFLMVRATMVSSVRISAVKLMATMWINSSSNSSRAPNMMTPP